MIGCVLTAILRRRLKVAEPRFAFIGGGSQFAADLGWIERLRLATRRNPVTVLLWGWLLACVAGISMGGDWWFHYLIQIAAPFSIWIAPMMLDVGDRLRGIARWTYVAAICAVLLYPFTVAASGNPYDTTASLYPNQKYEGQAQVAAYIREHATPDTPILVAFDQAALYYLSDHPAAYRYMYEQEMKAIPNAEQQLVAIVSSENRPEYVIDTDEDAPFADSGKAFWDAVQQNYQIEVVINGFKIYRSTS
jgi:hypothetical protein